MPASYLLTAVGSLLFGSTFVIEGTVIVSDVIIRNRVAATVVIIIAAPRLPSQSQFRPAQPFAPVQTEKLSRMLTNDNCAAARRKVMKFYGTLSVEWIT